MSYKKTWFKKGPRVNSQNKVICRYEITPCYGYPGFQLYFSEIEPEERIKLIVRKTQTFQSFIYSHSALFPYDGIQKNCRFYVDYAELLRDVEFNREWPEFQVEIIENTEECLLYMGLAMHQVITKENTKSQEAKNVLLPIIRCGLENYDVITPIRDINSSTHGNLISIRGTVIKASGNQLETTHIEFKCNTCTGTQLVRQPNGIYTVPKKCSSKGCYAKSNFTPTLGKNTRTVDFQLIKVQELVSETAEEAGRVPKNIECELIADLVDVCKPGDDVTIIGVVKARNTKDPKQPSFYQLYLSVVFLKNQRNQVNESEVQFSFNTADYVAIQKINAEPDLFRYLVQSLCPGIYGHEIVKAGLLLGLFGGTNTNECRSESHILLVGDPGLGKSQMLKACCNVAPRGFYVCGNTSTTSGLTVTMTREGGDYALEAGALVLANNGCCCIDEFDKMKTQHACLLEVMEQQTISIAKAGITCSISTKASILAAANPIGGHYDKDKSISENLKMSSPLLSRFDLIFILLDKPNEAHDRQISNHILARRFGLETLPPKSNTSMNSSENSQLANRLRVDYGERIDHLPHALFRKYIAYAQKYVNPKLSSGACRVLKQFYLELRRKYSSTDCTPVTARQQESLLRLTQARAKLELREEATEEDAREVIEIMKCCLIDVLTDESGNLDLTRSQAGTGMSKSKKKLEFVKRLQSKSHELERPVLWLSEIREVADGLSIAGPEFRNLIESLNIQGYLLKKSGSKYQVCVSDML